MKSLVFALLIFIALIDISEAAVSSQRVASLYLSQDFINQQIKDHLKSETFKDVSVELDPNKSQIFVRGLLQIPVEQLKAVNLDPKLGAFRFQFTVRPKASQQGYLILEFPLNETFFYPSSSKNPNRDKVMVPVQMLSLALASARGYFAALSGDFSGFDRQAEKLKAVIHGLEKAAKETGNTDARDELNTQIEAKKLQLAAVPIERKQLQFLGKQLGKVMSFAGESELNLNQELAAYENALVIKLDLEKFTPFLKGVRLGGFRIVHDHIDGPHGENYFSMDINADVNVAEIPPQKPTGHREGMKIPPEGVIRIRQALFDSAAVKNIEQQKVGSKLSDLKLEMKDDGLHLSGKYHKFFVTVPFDAVVDFESTDIDAFEISVRDVEVAGIDMEFLTGFVLEAMQHRLENSFHDMCQFEYLGEQKDRSRALQVTIDSKKLIPALPDLHVVDVDVRDQEFLLKVGTVR